MLGPEGYRCRRSAKVFQKEDDYGHVSKVQERWIQEPVGESDLASSGLFRDWTASGCIDDMQRYRLLRRPCQPHNSGCLDPPANKTVQENRSLSGRRRDSPTHSYGNRLDMHTIDAIESRSCRG